MRDIASYQDPITSRSIDHQAIVNPSGRGPSPSPSCSDHPGASKDGDAALIGQLRDRLKRAGCFRAAPWSYGIRIALVLVASAVGYIALLAGPEPMMRSVLVLLIAFACVQAGFIAHDAGDGAVTANRKLAFWLRHVLMSLVSALSSSYFSYLHRVHHLTLQRGARGLGASGFAVNPYEIGWLKQLVAGNGVVFAFATVCLRGFTFKLESLRYVLRNRGGTGIDRVLMALHAMLWLLLPIPFIGVLDAMLNYALITLAIGPYVGTILILNHSGMSKAQSLRGMSTIERVVQTTRNLGRSRWSDFVFGGVNNHIEHHLFPQIPAARLRHARAITRNFCGEHGIPYSETGFVRAIAEALYHFRAVPRARLAAEALS